MKAATAQCDGVSMMSALSAPIPALMKMAVPPLDPFSSLFSSAAPQKEVHPFRNAQALARLTFLLGR